MSGYIRKDDLDKFYRKFRAWTQQPASDARALADLIADSDEVAALEGKKP